MSKHTDAADAIRRMAKQYEQMVVAADILDQIGSLDNAAKEAQTVATAMQAEVATAKEDLAKAKADIKVAKAKAEEIMQSAADQAAAATQSARAEAARLLADTTAKMEATRASIQQGIDVAQAEAQSRADVLAGLIVERQKKVAEINDQVADAEARLEKAEKQMASMKAKLTALVD